MLADPLLVTRWLCVFTLAWFVSKFTITLDDAITVSSTLACLAFTFFYMGKKQNHHHYEKKSCHSESPADTVMRKQIQCLNWMIVYNKALALHHKQRNMYFEIKIQKHLKRCSNHHDYHDDTLGKIKSIRKMKKWNSWSGSVQIPDFHAQDCRNSLPLYGERTNPTIMGSNSTL
jgi:hypothetical protein